MTPCYAILLDAGFLKYSLGTRKKPTDAKAITDFIEKVKTLPALKDMRLHRVYFYDAKPLEEKATNPLDASVIDFGSSPTAAHKKSQHAALGRADFFSLRFGDLFRQGWELKKHALKKASVATAAGKPATLTAGDIQPSIRQKGVDMRIGLDIASLTLKKHVAAIVLVTADSDFVPAMKFARREGAQLFLITLGYGVKETMREHADLVIEKV